MTSIVPYFNKIFQNKSFILFLVKILNAGLNFSVSYTLAKLIGAEGLGVFAFAISWMTLFSVPGTLGFNHLLVREISIYKTSEKWNLLQGLINYSSRLTFIYSIVLGLIAITVALTMDLLTSEFLVPFCIAIAALPFRTLILIKSSILKGLKEVIIGHLPEQVCLPLLFLSLALIYRITNPESISPTVVVILYIMAILTISLGISVVQSQKSPAQIKSVKQSTSRKEWICGAIPMMFLGGMQIIFTRTDIIMLGIFNGSKDVGIYVVVSRLASLITFALVAINNTKAPEIASHYAKNHISKIQHIAKFSARASTAAAIPIAIIFCTGGDKILAIFGTEFQHGYIALAIISFGSVINAMTGPVGNLLKMTKNQNFALISSTMSAVLNLGLNWWLIPQYGITGAATATAISMSTMNVSNTIFTLAKLKINPTVIPGSIGNIPNVINRK